MATHPEDSPHHARQLHAAQAVKLVKDGERYIRLAELVKICGVGKSYVYKGMADGTFPKCLHLPGGKMVAWRSSDLDAWMRRVEAANAAALGVAK